MQKQVTFAESKEADPFDWNAFLNKSEYTREELRAAILAASSWVTCACGNQCDIIPRYLAGAPVDSELELLGLQFTAAIIELKTHTVNSPAFIGTKKAAINILDQIEKRSVELIKKYSKCH